MAVGVKKQKREDGNMSKFMNDVKCKIYIGMFILTFVIFATIFTENNVVHAANTQYVDSSTDFISEQMTIPSDDTVPVATGEYADWLFAGWYSESTCTEESIIKSKTVGLSAWAKFVPADVLTVKCQVKSDIDNGNASSTNMRLVSSVDTLNYSKVGFEVIYNNGIQEREAIDIPTTTVYSRIKASANSGVDYNYSPKVVDTKSEWFVTATLVNINKNNYNNCFLIKPYWETYDGTVVYGQSRYVKVSDSYSDVVNLSVEAATESDLNALTVSEETIKEYRFSDNGNGWGSIVLTETKSALPSVTKYTTSDGQVAYWRNLETKYTGSGTEDTSWYDVYGNRAGEYVIATSADLYGFVSVVNTPKFYFLLGDVKSIVYMVADIEVNKGTASPTGWSLDYSEDGVTKTGTDYKWTGIGTGSNVFKGIFDGQGHTISGINGTNGLFYKSYSTTEIRNVNLTNTYLVPPQNGSGSIVSLASGGKIENVCSDAFINNTSRFWVGGIVGAQNTTGTVLTMQDCSYSGTITTAKAATGGIIGKNTVGTANITDCRFSGSINASEVNEIGGLVGTNSTTLTITDCESSGSITAGWYTGGFVGKNENSLTITGCEYLGSINSTQHQSGGLVGINNQSLTITDCKSSGSIETSGTQFGGLVGLNNLNGSLEITDCLFDGNIYITGSGLKAIGGFVGKNLGSTFKITSCLNSGTLTNSGGQSVTAVCRLVGMNSNTSMKLDKAYYTNEGLNGTSSYYSEVTPATSQICIEVARTAVEGNLAFFNTVLFKDSDRWALVLDDETTEVDESSTPVLKTFADKVPNEPEIPENADVDWYIGVYNKQFTICNNDDNDANVKELYGLAYLVNEQGITFDSCTVTMQKDVTVNVGTVESWESNDFANLTEWAPIGVGLTAFAGTFDGANHKISGIYINSSEQGTGLFRSTAAGSTIQNLKLEESYIKSTSKYVGSIVGTCGGNITNVSSDAKIIGSDYYVGGLVGGVTSNNVTIDSSCFSGQVTSSFFVGGIIGCVDATGCTINITNCYSTGTVTGSGNGVGGVLGYSTNCTVNMGNCLNAGKVSTGDAGAGGLLGRNGSYSTMKISYCLNRGTIEGSKWSGSVVGWWQSGTVTATSVYGTGTIAVGNDKALTNATMVDIKNITVSDTVTVEGIRETLSGLFGEDTIWTIGAEEGSMPELQLN